jgi:long-chain acyl-CoA synthetase
MLNLATLLENSAREFPDKVAFVFREFRLTYMMVNALANQVANGLAAAGLGRGDKVALLCPNIPYFPICYYGILKAGCAVVPLNVLLREREIAYHLQDSDAKAFIAFEGTPELPLGEACRSAVAQSPQCEHFWMLTANPAGESPFEDVPTLAQMMNHHPPIFETVQTSTEDTAVILYTSGTTGHPKGAELTHSNMTMNAMVAKDLCDLRPEDISLVALPLFHSFGQSSQMNTGILSGGTMILLPRFEAAAAIQAMKEEKVTIFCGVPTMYWDFLHCPDLNPDDIQAIAGTWRLGVSGGAAMPVELLRQFEEKFGIVILEGYGLSETSPTATFNRMDRPRKVGSIGLPIWGVEIRVVDDDMNDVPVGDPGEVVIRGHNVMKGYYNRQEANQEAFRGGWFHTGDVGTIDEDGYFYIVDRTKDMIIRGGFNVYPREIEEVLMMHPAVSLAAVIGTPHDEYGEEIKAVVVLKPGKTVTEDELRAWGRKEMAAYKYPRIVEIRESLPMGPTGKILKKELRKQELAAAETKQTA